MTSRRNTIANIKAHRALFATTVGHFCRTHHATTKKTAFVRARNRKKIAQESVKTFVVKSCERYAFVNISNDNMHPDNTINQKYVKLTYRMAYSIAEYV